MYQRCQGHRQGSPSPPSSAGASGHQSATAPSPLRGIDPAQLLTSGETQQGFWPHLLDPLRQVGHKVAGFFAPAADVSAGAEHYDIRVELPGVKESDLQLEVHGNVL